VWGNISGATALNYDPPAGLAQTTEYRRRVISGACAALYSNTLTVSVSPLIAGEIAADQLICDDTSAATLNSVTLASGGVGLRSYVWQFSADGVNFSDIIGATDGNAYSPGALSADTWFRRSVSNACAAVETAPVLVSVAAPLDAGAIGYDQTVCRGEQPQIIKSINDGAGGFGLGDYRWESSIDGVNWEVIPEARDPEYLPPPLDRTTLYRRVFINNCGEKESRLVTVTVANLQPGALAGSQSICWGAAPALFTSSVDASGGKAAPTYQWQSSPDLSAWSNIGTATSTNYQAGALSTTTYFRRSADDTCDTVYTGAVTVSVATQVSGGSVGSGQTICPGATPAQLTSFTDGSGGLGASTYRWESTTDLVNWSSVANGAAANYQPLALNVTTYFRRRYQNGCGSAYTKIVKVTVSALSAGSVAADQTICYNTSPAVLTNATSASGGVGVTSYFWQVSPNASSWSTIAFSNSTTYPPPNLTSTTYFRRAAQNICGIAYTTSLLITVADRVTPGEISGDQTICSGAAVAPIDEVVSASGGIGQVTYIWLQSVDGINWDPVPEAFDATYRPAEVPQTTWYRRLAVNECDSAESNTVQIRVVDGGVITPDSQFVALGGVAMPLESLDDGGAGAFGGVFNWERLANELWGGVRGCAGMESCGAIDTRAAGSYVYRRIVTFEVCGGVSYESNYATVDVVAK